MHRGDRGRDLDLGVGQRLEVAHGQVVRAEHRPEPVTGVIGAMFQRHGALEHSADALARDEERRGPLEVEIERLRGERDRALIDLAEARATTGQLERALADERETVIRQDEFIRNRGSDRGDGPETLGWLPFLVLLVLVAAVAFWRELWWRSRILTARRLPAIHEGSSALARPVAGVPSVKGDVQDR